MVFRVVFVTVVLALIGFVNAGVVHAEDGGKWVTLFDGNSMWGWTDSENVRFRINGEQGGLQCGLGLGWLRSDQLYDDFILEFETRVPECDFDGALFFRAGLDGQPWPVQRHEIRFRKNQMGRLLLGDKTLAMPSQENPRSDTWDRWRLHVEGACGTLERNGRQVWSTDQLKPGRGRLGLKGIANSCEFRNIRIQEIGYVDLLAGEPPVGDTLIPHQGSADAWSINEKNQLVCSGGSGGWIGTRTSDYGDFDLKLEFNVPAEGNSGVFIRCPFEGNPAYTGMEIQVIDDDAQHWGELQPWQKTGSIYHEVAPARRATRSAGQWQTMEIYAKGPTVKIYVNGINIIKANLDKYTTCSTEAAPLKDRPRMGYIGFQNYGNQMLYRNIRVKRLGGS